MSTSKKIIEGNNQPSEGNAVVGGGGARALNPSEFIDPNHVLSVDASGQSIVDINNSLQGRFFRAVGLLNRYPNAAAAYGLRSLQGVSSSNIVRLRRASDNAESDFTAADLAGSVTGSELVTNGDFATDSDWTKDTGWSITGGQAVCDGTQVSTASLDQNGIWNPVADGDLYILEITIVACSDFSRCGLYGGVGSLRNFSATYGITAPGTYRCIRQKQGDGNPFDRFQIYASSGETITVDNVSLKPFTPTAAEQWSFANMTFGIGNQANESAYATTWYDQSGSGNDATQSTSTAQPKLITAGVTELENGKPTLVLDGSNDHLDIGSMGLLSTPWLFSVGKLRSPDTSEQILFDSGTAERFIVDNGFGYAWYPAPSIQGNSLYSNGQYQLATYGVGYGETYRDGVVVDSGLNPKTNIDTTNNIATRIGQSSTGGKNGTYNLQEIVLYPTDQYLNRIGIETNINEHYSIYQDGIIDLYTTPVAAYSLDSLARSYKSQPVIEARRLTSDTRDFNALQIADGTLESWAKESLLPPADHGDGAAAAYSLRYISDNRPTNNNVARVRRGSDSSERDFKPVEISNGDLQNWVNGYSLDAPADYDSGAAAAYSLRHVSDSYTGDVVKVVRSGDDAVLDFNPTEVTDGTLETWVRHLDGTQPADFGSGAAAAYSLRNVASGMTASDPVVRLRRASDSTEQDFTAADLRGSVTGADLITNGDFSNGSTDWNFTSASWSVSGGQASCDGTSTGACRQFGRMGNEAGNYFKVTFDIIDCNDYAKSGTQHDSNIVTRFDLQGITSPGTYTQLVKTQGINGHTVFNVFVAGGTLTIDNVIVQPYTPTAAELWVLNGATLARQTLETALVTTLYDQAASNEQVFGDPTIQSPGDWTDSGSFIDISEGLISIENAFSGFFATYNGGDIQPGTYRLEVDYYGVTQANRIAVEGLLLPIGSGTVSETITVASSNTLQVTSNGGLTGQTGYITGIRLIDLGNPATQSTAAAQPKLITGGFTELDNGKPAMVFDGSDDYLDITTNPLTVLDNLMVAVVAKPLGATGEYGVTLSEQPQRIYVPYLSSGNMYIAYDDSATKLDDGAITNDQQLLTLSVDASTASGFKNGAAFSVTPTATADSGAIVDTGNAPQIGALGGGGNWNGTFQEIIIYDSDQSANRTDIEAGIMGYYGIAGYGEGAVSQWYDQSGNSNHATQSVVSDRPKIVTNGDLVVKDGKPAIMMVDFDSKLIMTSYPVSNIDTFAIFNVYTLTDDDSVNNGYGFLSLGSSTNNARLYASRILSGQERFGYADNQNAIGLGAIEKDQQIMRSYVTDGVNVNLRKNGDNLQTIAVQSNSNVQQFRGIGEWPALVQESIIYDSDQSENRGQIESNMNAYYGVYSQPEVDDGFVTTWYDQSGNGNHAEQTTAAAQPKIVSDGVLVTENGKPVIVFDGSNDHLDLGGMGLLSTPWLFSVGRLRSPDSTQQILFDTGGSERLIVDDGRAYSWYDAGGVHGAVSLYEDGQYQLATYGVGYGETYRNGVVLESGLTPTTNIDTNNNSASAIGSVYSGNSSYAGVNLQEFILYPSDQSSNRQAIEYNINNYYSIYSAPSGMADAFVSKWYDQVGSNNMVESDVAKQPKIVVDGTLLTDSDNRPIMQLVTDDGLVASSGIGTTADYDDLFSSDQGSDFFNSAYNSSYNYKSYPGELDSSSANMYNIRHRIVWNEDVLSTADKTAIKGLINSQVSFSGVTDWTGKFRSWSKLKEMPLVDSSNATSMSSTWRDCSSLVDFPLIDTSSVANFTRTWRNTGIVTFPSLNLSSGTTFNQSWSFCSGLENFPANMFDNCTATDFTDAFRDTNLSQTSIDNILVSIDAAGQTNGTFNQSGGSAPSAVGEAAIDSLFAKGWTVVVTGGYNGFYNGASALYSLRKATSSVPNVVRLRRASDNAEQDFTAADLEGSVEGAELVTNGGFDTDTNWAKGSNWTITGGQAVSDGTVEYGSLTQDIIPTTIGTVCKISFTIVACSDFTQAGMVVNSSSFEPFSTKFGITATGTYSLIFTTNSTDDKFRFVTRTGVTMTIDDVSVVEYTPTAVENWAKAASRMSKQDTNSAYATTWYDQSGSGNDATQSTAAAQPLLVRAGVTNTENGKPALSFDGTDDYLGLGSTALSTVRHDSFMVMQTSDATHVMTSQDSFSAAYGWVAQGGRSSTLIHSLFGSPTLYTNGTEPAQVNRGDISNALSTGLQVLQSTIDADTSAWTDFLLCGFGSGGAFDFVGNIQELIVYPSDQSDNREDIEDHINDYYNIYGGLDSADAYDPNTSLIGGTNSPATSAAYSLRSLDGNAATNVVRLRRAGDSAESDFTAADLAGSVEGAELVTNGDFTTDSDWNKSAGWTISGGQASCTAPLSPSLLTQDVISSVGIGEYFILTFDLVATTTYNNSIRTGVLTSSFSLLDITTTGTHSLLVERTGAASDLIGFLCGTGQSMTIDNVSVKPYTLSTAEDWAFTGVNQGNVFRLGQVDVDSALVTTWYDQSGNGKNATQATATRQPLLISAGVTNTENGKPALSFDGSDDWLDLRTVQFSATVDELSAFTVTATNNLSTGQMGLVASSLNRFYVPRLRGDGNLKASYSGDGSLDDGAYDTSQHLVSLVCDQATNVVRAFNDGAAFSVTPANVISTGATNNSNNAIGAFGEHSNRWDGNIQEVVIYASDQSTQRLNIETNINNHYNIY